MKGPKGVVAVFIDDRGNIISSVSEFARDGIGGYTLREAQEYRAKEFLSAKIARAYCSDQWLRGMDSHRFREVMNQLIRQHGCKLEIIEVGYGEEPTP